jgi:hypothetical protein
MAPHGHATSIRNLAHRSGRAFSARSHAKTVPGPPLRFAQALNPLAPSALLHRTMLSKCLCAAAGRDFLRPSLGLACACMPQKIAEPHLNCGDERLGFLFPLIADLCDIVSLESHEIVEFKNFLFVS